MLNLQNRQTHTYRKLSSGFQSLRMVAVSDCSQWVRDLLLSD